MDGLWSIINSLSIKNKKWLVDKLITSLTDSEESKDKEILKGIAVSMNEAKSGNTLPIDSLWNQL